MSFVESKYQYRCIPFLAIFYGILGFTAILLRHGMFLTNWGPISVNMILAPFWFILGDVFAEVYGFKMMMRLFWSFIICNLIIGLIFLLLINFNSFATVYSQHIYQFVLGDYLQIRSIHLVLIIVAWKINAYLLNKWKILLKGRYFWLRSIGSSGIGESIFIILIYNAEFLIARNFSYAHVWILILIECAVRVFITALFAFPATIAVAIIRHLEKIDINQSTYEFNPFNKPAEN